ncbi:unnamed protein product [Microthlaspi erraticum]|uniref:Uncharacterized protein n=1 Tax=Microthlaspi erraticum TaxID=1685480 RepID=A0A6D2HLJ3_9BRAS|nr:unnamed protein product [Microthlaspi erraticum]
MHRKRGNGSTPSIPPETKASPRRRSEYRRIASGKARWHRWRPRRKDQEQLVILLKQNVHLFAWSMADMKGIDPAITSHELNVDSTYKPMRQKRRKLGADKAQAVNEEVEKLLRAGSITK